MGEIKTEVSAREMFKATLRFFGYKNDEDFIDRTIFELLTLEKKLGANIKTGFDESSNKEIESIKGIIEIKKLLYQIYKDNPFIETQVWDGIEDLKNANSQS